MMKIGGRLEFSFRAMFWHFVVSLIVALNLAALIFFVWFPYPYQQIAGGIELFLMIIGVDLICGPLLTLILFNPAKSRLELIFDLSIVVATQLVALGYGIFTLHQVRPLYLVHEFDRFKVIALVDVDASELAKLPKALQHGFFKDIQTVGLRAASEIEREKVMFESVQGGRDFGERPTFYASYDGVKAYQKAHPLSDFVKKHPYQQAEIIKLTGSVDSGATLLRYLPIIARQDWVAVLDGNGQIVGYLKGDGF